MIVSFYLIGGRLVEFDHNAQRYVSGLAESWQRGEDGRTLEIVLREGIKFSDGQPITAQDLQFTLRAIYDERTASPIFRDAMMIGGRQIEVIIKDARHLKWVFPELVVTPENYLSNLAILPRHLLEAKLDRGALREAYGLSVNPAQIVTAGAFAADSAVPGERITLKRNPHYWKKDQAGASLPYLDQLVVEVISDANNAMTQLRGGSLDLLDRLRTTDYAALRASTQTARAYDLGPGLNTDHLWFNLNGKGTLPIKQAWFANVRFRRAISYAIDRETLAAATLQGLATPLVGFVSPGNRAWLAPDLPRTPYDLNKAQSLLREVGVVTRGQTAQPELYDAGGNRVEFTLIVPAESQARIQMATVIQEDLARLGIKLNVAPIEFGEFNRRISQSFDYDAALLGASVSEPDPSAYANFLRSSSPTHQWHPKQTRPATEWEARIDELLAAQARETDAERRRAAFFEIQRILAEQLPIIPIVARHTTAAANQRVGNYNPSALLPYALWNAEDLFVRKP